MTGRVLEIREFCLHDGPGPRTTIFLQGCPLRCAWCQNPEGQDAGGGREMTAEEVAAEVLKTADFLWSSGGGVTFSGGEPLCQADFLLEIRSRLEGLTAFVETSGYAPHEVYRRVISALDGVYQDVKFPEAEGYRRWANVDAAPIFANLRWLMESDIPSVVRIPLIPGVNDDAATKSRFAELLKGAEGLQRIELLPYNPLAGSKYRRLGRVYSPGFDESRPCDLSAEAFAACDIPVVAM